MKSRPKEKRIALVLWILAAVLARGTEPVCPPDSLRPRLSLPRWEAHAFHFRLDGAPNATYLLQMSTDLREWTTFSTNDSTAWQPWIRLPSTATHAYVRAALDDPVYPLFNFAVRAAIGIVSNSVGIEVDSYDSSNPLFSTARGEYDPAKARDGGDLALGSGDDGNHYLGNSKIKGKVFTAVGSTVTLGPNGAIGSTSWHGGGMTGIQPGWTTSNLRPTFMPPPVAVPFVSGIVPARGVVGGVFYDYVLMTGDYQLNAINAQEILVLGNARLFVTGPISVRGSILISTNASLQIFCAADVFFGGTGIINQADITNFQFYGLPSNSSVTFVQNTTLRALIYAPNADCTMLAGGALDFCGACIVRQLHSSNLRIHLDEHLKRFCRP